MWTGEGGDGDTLFGSVSVQRGQLDLLEELKLRQVQSRMSKRTIDDCLRLFEIEGLENLGEKMQGAACKIS